MHFNIGNGDENLILQLKWTYVRDKFDKAIKTKIETIYQLKHFYLYTFVYFFKAMTNSFFKRKT